MTQSAECLISTQHGSRYLQQLAKHWAHKFDVEFDPATARITASEGRAVIMAASESILKVTVTAPGDLALDAWREVVARHIERFAFREELAFDWQPA